MVVADDTDAMARTKGEKRVKVDPPKVEYAFTVVAQLDALRQAGTSYEGEHRFYPIVGGTFEGRDLHGEVMPGGGDWQTVRPDGMIVLDARYALRTDDGAVIQVYNRGLVRVSEPLLRTSAQFVAPTGRHDWLNKFIFVGTVKVPDGRIDHVRVDFFKVL
jgi:hypothetical protein